MDVIATYIDGGLIGYLYFIPPGRTLLMEETLNYYNICVFPLTLVYEHQTILIQPGYNLPCLLLNITISVKLKAAGIPIVSFGGGLYNKLSTGPAF